MTGDAAGRYLCSSEYLHQRALVSLLHYMRGDVRGLGVRRLELLGYIAEEMI